LKPAAQRGHDGGIVFIEVMRPAAATAPAPMERM
jgi:hypothetical protein